MPEDSKQMGARASNSPQLSLSSVKNVTDRLQDALSREKNDCESRIVSLGYVSEDDGDLEFGFLGSEKSSDNQN